MIRIMANERAPSARGIFSPLRYAVFRRIWTASLLSNLGILVLGVGAAWTMTQISSSADMVALVQTSLTLPVALVSTPAGAIADMFDRRIVGPARLLAGPPGNCRQNWPSNRAGGGDDRLRPGAHTSGRDLPHLLDQTGCRACATGWKNPSRRCRIIYLTSESSIRYGHHDQDQRRRSNGRCRRRSACGRRGSHPAPPRPPYLISARRSWAPEKSTLPASGSTLSSLTTPSTTSIE